MRRTIGPVFLVRYKDSRANGCIAKGYGGDEVDGLSDTNSPISNDSIELSQVVRVEYQRLYMVR